MSTGFRRWPDYEHLCDLAEVKGLRVHVGADDAQFMLGMRSKDPAISRIELCGPTSGMRPQVAPVYNGDLDAAARELLARLG